MSQDENSNVSKDRRPLSLFKGWLLLVEGQRALAGTSRSTSITASTVRDLGQRYDVPFIPTSLETAKRMLKIAEVGPADVVYDLGCGDARILILAVGSFKARKAVGYEVRSDVFKAALREVQVRNLSEHVTVINGNLFHADLSGATVITLYLNYETNRKLKPKLETEAKVGARVVSHDFEIPTWRPVRKEKHCGDIIYLYTVPKSL